MDNAKLYVKKMGKIAVILLVVFSMALSLGACENTKDENLKIYSDFLGTEAVVLINANADFFWQKDKLEKCFKDIEETLSSISETFSTENENSYVYKFNQLNSGESIEVSEEFSLVFEKAKTLYEKTNHAFDSSVKNLVDLWGFSKEYASSDYKPKYVFDRERNIDGSFALPDDKYIEAFIKLCDFSSISLENGKLTKNCPSQIVDGISYQQKIDFSGMIKGYASDKVNDIIKACGYDDYYISLGTSSLYLAKHNGGGWKIEITNPNNPQGAGYMTRYITNSFVSTSGAYQNCYEVDGKKYHHIIDGKTGKPAETDILSLTIIGYNGAECDAYSTALMLGNAESACKFLSDGNFLYEIITEEKSFSAME